MQDNKRVQTSTHPYVSTVHYQSAIMSEESQSETYSPRAQGQPHAVVANGFQLHYRCIHRHAWPKSSSVNHCRGHGAKAEMLTLAGRATPPVTLSRICATVELWSAMLMCLCPTLEPVVNVSQVEDFGASTSTV
eukprot:m.1637626 g.1637626  ORF g.1637626 m.1637626 type:complete len:134 (-) comp25984_c0_seq1:1397-1798(-)